MMGAGPQGNAAPVRPAPVVEARGLDVGYDGRPLLAGVDLHVEPGRVVTLIGPNGAGKSTILKTVAAQLAPTGGAVYLSGKPLSRMGPHEVALQLSVLLTERLRTERLTCGDVVEMGRYPHTGRLGILGPADHVAVREAMGLVQVWDLRDRDFMQVSDGQRQRVLLARAICQRPRALVLDEPTSYLDIRYQIDLLNILRELVAQGDVGVLMSLHELPLARRVSDWVVCVREDGVFAQGAPDAVFVPEVIDALYGLAPGTYDPATGDISLKGRAAAHAPVVNPGLGPAGPGGTPPSATSRAATSGSGAVMFALSEPRSGEFANMPRCSEERSARAGAEGGAPAGPAGPRPGFTTGACAAAAARAAAELLLTGVAPRSVALVVPAGIAVQLEIEEPASGDGWASCAVRKDAGDDPDVTDGLLVFARVDRVGEPGVLIEGGAGVGRVTRPGLDQPVGTAAINSVPRRMIREQVEEALRDAPPQDGGFLVTVSVPGGEGVAERTFNPRLGICGGISIIGTSGIVKPMSEDAVRQSIWLEMRQRRAEGALGLVVVPGNYGADFARDALGLDVEPVMCSNYVGEAIDEAVRLGFSDLLFVGHIGKMAKVAAGAMNTHSRVADGRMHALAAHAAATGASPDAVASVLAATTTDAALDILEGTGVMSAALDSLAGAIRQRLAHRAGDALRVEAIVFSKTRGLLCQTAGVAHLLGSFRPPFGACHLVRNSLQGYISR